MVARAATSPHERSSTPSDDGADANAVPKHPKSLQQLFLQAFVSRRVLSEAAAQELYKGLAKLCEVNNRIEFVDFLAECRTGLELLGLDIQTVRDQATSTVMLVLVNAVSDETSKLATECRPEEIAFFRLLVEAIMTAPQLSYCQTVNQAVRISSDARISPSMTKAQAQELIKGLVARGWLHLSSDRLLTLSTRSLAELTVYLRDTFSSQEDDAVEPHDELHVECTVCMSLVTLGWACPSPACGVRMHLHCSKVRLSARSECPNFADCGQRWPVNPATTEAQGIPIGVKSALDDDDDDEIEPPSTKKRAAPASRKRKSTGRTSNTRIESDGEIDELETQRTASRKHGESSDEVDELEGMDD